MSKITVTTEINEPVDVNFGEVSQGTFFKGKKYSATVEFLPGFMEVISSK